MMVKVLSPNPHVDRDEELRIFRRLLRGDHPGHMLLIQAGQGMGKTALMEEFYSQSEQYPRALIDLRPLDYTPAQVLGELSAGLETTVKGLGGVAAFPQYTEQRARASPGGRYTDTGFASVQREPDGDLGHASLAEKAALQIITDAFFSDLDAVIQKYGRVVLIVDTFEKASIDVSQWVTGLFSE